MSSIWSSTSRADGWFNLLRAIGDMPLGATVAFSSIAGRFGNAGQADYSSANDLLCKITSSFRTTRPATRGIAIDWTAWGGIGMAARGSIPKMMELAGIDMLPPEAGIPLIRRELTAGATRGEIVIGRRLGILLNEWDATGGLDASARVPGAARTGTDGRQSREHVHSSRPHHRDDARPAGSAVPARSSDRWHACAARRHGHRGLCRSCPSRFFPAGMSTLWKTLSSWRRSNSTGMSRAPLRSRRYSIRRAMPCCRLPVDGQPATPESVAAASNYTLHGSRAAPKTAARSETAAHQ